MGKSTSISIPSGGQRWNESEARAVIAAASASGLSISAFAQLKGLRPKRLYKWRRRLTAAPAKNANRVQAFVEVSLPTNALVEVVLRSGRVLRVCHSIDGDALLRLVELLERGGAC